MSTMPPLYTGPMVWSIAYAWPTGRAWNAASCGSASGSHSPKWYADRLAEFVAHYAPLTPAATFQVHANAYLPKEVVEAWQSYWGVKVARRVRVLRAPASAHASYPISARLVALFDADRPSGQVVVADVHDTFWVEALLSRLLRDMEGSDRGSGSRSGRLRTTAVIHPVAPTACVAHNAFRLPLRLPHCSRPPPRAHRLRLAREHTRFRKCFSAAAAAAAAPRMADLLGSPTTSGPSTRPRAPRPARRRYLSSDTLRQFYKRGCRMSRSRANM